MSLPPLHTCCHRASHHGYGPQLQACPRLPPILQSILHSATDVEPLKQCKKDLVLLSSPPPGGLKDLQSSQNFTLAVFAPGWSLRTLRSLSLTFPLPDVLFPQCSSPRPAHDCHLPSPQPAFKYQLRSLVFHNPPFLKEQPILSPHPNLLCSRCNAHTHALFKCLLLCLMSFTRAEPGWLAAPSIVPGMKPC